MYSFTDLHTYIASKKKRKASVVDARIHSKRLKKEHQQTKQNNAKSTTSSSVRPVSPIVNSSTNSTTNYSRYKQHKLNFATTLTTTASSNTIYQLKPKSIDLNLRSFHDNNNSSKVDYSKDYLRQIGVYLKGNYNIKRITNKTQSSFKSNNRRSGRNLNKDTTVQHNNGIHPSSNEKDVGSILSGYVRCYVEDYMSLQENTSIRLLYPSDQIIFEDHEPIHQLQLSSSKFDVFDCVINTAPNYNWVNQSLTYKDIKHALT